MQIWACGQPQVLIPISVGDFTDFVAATGYQTEAEQYGWSIVQLNVYDFKTAEGANWRSPDGINPIGEDMPITQVSFNDAMAYCEWVNARLPTYEEYWSIAQRDKRKINQNSDKLLPLDASNIIGNAWEMTTTENTKGEIQLAGGSYFCNPTTCNGTDPSRQLFVDKTTGNIHISFSVIK